MMGIPTASAESFDLLQAKDVIDMALSEKLKQMVHLLRRGIVVGINSNHNLSEAFCRNHKLFSKFPRT